MKFKELKTKSDKELEMMLNKSREDLQALRFKVASRQFKNVREIRLLRRQIAKILTLRKQQMNQSKNLNK